MAAVLIALSITGRRGARIVVQAVHEAAFLPAHEDVLVLQAGEVGLAEEDARDVGGRLRGGGGELRGREGCEVGEGGQFEPVLGVGGGARGGELHGVVVLFVSC